MEYSHDEIDKLDIAELIELYRTKWTGSQREFCRIYKIHQGHFSGFLRGKNINAVNFSNKLSRQDG
jgi:hypothetical protein